MNFIHRKKFSCSFGPRCKKSLPSFPAGPIQVLEGHYKVSSEPSLLQTQLAQPVLSQGRYSSPLIIIMALLWTFSKSSPSFLCCGPQAWALYSRWCLMKAEQRGTITSLSMLAAPLLIQPMIHLVFQATSALYWLMPIFLSTKVSYSFFTGLLSSSSPMCVYIHLGLPQPNCSTFHLDLVEPH